MKTTNATYYYLGRGKPSRPVTIESLFVYTVHCGGHPCPNVDPKHDRENRLVAGSVSHVTRLA